MVIHVPFGDAASTAAVAGRTAGRVRFLRAIALPVVHGAGDPCTDCHHPVGGAETRFVLIARERREQANGTKTNIFVYADKAIAPKARRDATAVSEQFESAKQPSLLASCGRRLERHDVALFLGQNRDHALSHPDHAMSGVAGHRKGMRLAAADDRKYQQAGAGGNPRRFIDEVQRGGTCDRGS